MDKKLRQVTDNIHDTIYLSQLESELISTPYFYRLHDIYQSSTVYMTFPSNRTKRYEHSVGTMEVASSMLFSAVSNADNETKNELFKHLRKYLREIIDLAIWQAEEQNAQYFSKCKDGIDQLFASDNYDSIDDLIEENIKVALTDNCFSDSALDYFQYCPMETENKQKLENVENIFVYRCLLESVRIVALFHDVGHPPYSHIIEKVLENLYDKYKYVDGNNDWQKAEITNLRKCLTPYMTKESREAYSCQTIYSKSSLIEADPHERIGLSLLQSALNEVIPSIINEIVNSERKLSHKIALSIYYIMIVELSIAILVEKDDVFKSFHKIVDGIIDADRLDYIMRDSLNSGVDWGKIPYKRLINSAKLIYLKENEFGKIEETKRPFIIAYPKKVADDIEDLLLVRYKIFARINFHHRCMKTSVALQSAVMELAENYLNSNSESECINPDIKILWSALEGKAGGRKSRVIQWNDSWLISVLHKALVKINETERSRLKGKRSWGLTQVKALKENLEEILLNKKRYYSLLKRGNDSKEFVDKVFGYAEITDEKLDALESKEYKKLHTNEIEGAEVKEILELPGLDAVDSVVRIQPLRDAKKSGEIEGLWKELPSSEKPIEVIIEDVLQKCKKENEIEDFKVIINKGKQKTGIPRHKDLFDEIYLYDGSKVVPFDSKVTTLREQIEAIEKKVLWMYIYFVPPAKCEDIDKLADYLIDSMAKEVGLKLKSRYEELFGKGEHKV